MRPLQITGLIAVAVVLAITIEVIRRVGRPRVRAGHARCGSCGASSDLADSFQCPGCRRDYLNVGLVHPDAGASAARIAAVGLAVSFFLIAQGILAGFLDTRGSEGRYTYFAELSTFVPDFVGIHGVSLIFEDKDPVRAGGNRLLSDLEMSDGTVVSIEITGDPLTASIFAVTGERLKGPMPFDDAAIAAWMTAAGAEGWPEQIDEAVRQLGLKVSMSRPSGPLPSPRLVSSGSSGGGGLYHIASDSTTPWQLILGSFAWLPFLYLVLRYLQTPSSQLRAKPSLIDPVCGGCGYSVIGLNSLTCPECGSDLRRVGIVSAKRPRITLQMIAAMLSLSLAIVLMNGLLTPKLIEQLPTRRTISIAKTVQPPPSNAYAKAVVAGSGAWLNQSVKDLPVTITMTLNSGATTTINVDTPAGSVRYIDPVSRASVHDELTSRALLEWMRKAGVDVDLPGVQAHASGLALLAQQVSRSLRFTPNLGDFNGGWTITGVDKHAPLGNTSIRAIYKASSLTQKEFNYFWEALWALGIGWAYRAGRPRAFTAESVQGDPQPEPQNR